jgi:hypothetical protein
MLIIIIIIIINFPVKEVLSLIEISSQIEFVAGLQGML